MVLTQHQYSYGLLKSSDTPRKTVTVRKFKTRFWRFQSPWSTAIFRIKVSVYNSGLNLLLEGEN